jgi:hypothetical protein
MSTPICAQIPQLVGSRVCASLGNSDRRRYRPRPPDNTVGAKFPLGAGDAGSRSVPVGMPDGSQDLDSSGARENDGKTRTMRIPEGVHRKAGRREGRTKIFYFRLPPSWISLWIALEQAGHRARRVARTDHAARDSSRGVIADRAARGGVWGEPNHRCRLRRAQVYGADPALRLISRVRDAISVCSLTFLDRVR